jgi:hypothetical protein
MLKKALGQLEGQKLKIEGQIASLRLALNGTRPRLATARKARKRPHLSPAARRAASRRMKAYWAKRRAQAKKG